MTSQSSARYPKVAIIILNWNKWRQSINCLESLGKLNYPNAEIIVVDNGSTNDSVLRIKEWCCKNVLSKTSNAEYAAQRRIKGSDEKLHQRSKTKSVLRSIELIENEENMGYCEGNNVGIEYSLNSKNNPDYIFLLNNDAFPDTECLKHCVLTAQINNAGVVGAVTKSPDNDRIMLGDARFPLSFFYPAKKMLSANLSETWERDAVPGSGMLIRVDLLRQLKSSFGYYLNPSLFMYWDETDFCIRAKKLGFKILMAGRAFVYHEKHAIDKREQIPTYYYIARNACLVAKAMLNPFLKSVFFLYYPVYCVTRAIKKTFQKNREAAVAILKGLFDGFLGVRGKWKEHDLYYQLSTKK